MAKFLNYLFTGDDRPTPPVPLPIDDDSSDWWSGVARNFASVAVATAVAANALAAQLPYAGQWQEDEVPTPPPTVVAEEDSWIPPVAPIFKYEIPKAFSDDEVLPAHAFEIEQWIPPVPPPPPLVQPFVDQDEIPAGRLFGQYDEDFWSNPTAPIPATLRVPNPWDAEQNEQAVLWGVPVESEWNNLVKPDVQWLVKTFNEDEVIVTTAVTSVFEEDWTPPVIQPVAGLPQVFNFNDEVAQFILFDESGWIPPVLTQQWTANPFSSTDEVEQTVVNPAFESDWQVIAPPQLQWQSQLFSFNDEIEKLTVVESDWQINPTQRIDWQARVFSADDEIERLKIEESDWQVFQPRTLDWQVRVFNYNDDIKRVTVVEESDWNVPVIQPTQPAVQAFSADEDFVPVVQDYGESFIYIAPQQQPVIQAFADDEGLALVSAPIIDDETGWINSQMVLPAPPPIVFMFNDENPYNEFPGEPPPFSQRGCCNISGSTVTFGGCEEGAPVVFDECACPS